MVDHTSDNLKPLWAGWSNAPLSVHGESPPPYVVVLNIWSQA